MISWLSAEKAPELHRAVRADLRGLLVEFLAGKESSFLGFKEVWRRRGLSRLHHVCPRAVSGGFFLQVAYQEVLDLLHNLPEEKESFPPLPLPLLELLWNQTVIYTLHTLHYTRLEENLNTKIRLSPEVWAELLVAYERLELFPSHSSQSLRIFRLLVSNDVFQYAMFTGVPTLYRATAVIEEYCQSSSSSKPSLETCVQATKLLKENYSENSKLLFRNVAPTSDSSGGSQSAESSRTRPLNNIPPGSSTLSSGNSLGVVDDSSLADFFEGEENIPSVQSIDFPSREEVGSSVDILATLKSLEDSTTEIFQRNNASEVDASGPSHENVKEKNRNKKTGTASEGGLSIKNRNSSTLAKKKNSTSVKTAKKKSGSRVTEELLKLSDVVESELPLPSTSESFLDALTSLENETQATLMEKEIAVSTVTPSARSSAASTKRSKKARTKKNSSTTTSVTNTKSIESSVDDGSEGTEAKDDGGSILDMLANLERESNSILMKK